MKTRSPLLWLTVTLLSVVLHARAQESARPQPPPKYRMELVYVLDAAPAEFIFVIGDSEFKTVESLKSFLSLLPAGATLEWAPGCMRVGREPLLSSEGEMEDFKEFCAALGINFVLVPSG